MSCYSNLTGRQFHEICKCGHTVAVHMPDGNEVACQICDLREYLAEEINFVVGGIISGRHTLHEAMQLVSEKLND